MAQFNYDMNTADDVRKTLNGIMTDYRNGVVSDKEAKTLGYLCQTIHSSIKQVTTDKRVEELEKLIEERLGDNK